MSSVQYYLDPLNGQCKVPAVEISNVVCELNISTSIKGNLRMDEVIIRIARLSMRPLQVRIDGI